MLPALDAVFFCEDPPIIEVRDGLVHIIQQIGGMRLERVMRLSTFTELVRAGQQVIAEHHARPSAEIISLPWSHVPDEAASGH